MSLIFMDKQPENSPDWGSRQKVTSSLQCHYLVIPIPDINFEFKFEK